METDDFAAPDQGLDRVKLFEGLQADQLRAIEAQCRWLTLEPTQRALGGEDRTEDIYFIVSGRVRVLNHLADGSECLLAELGVGDCFGELSAVDSQAHSAEVVGHETCLVAALPTATFRGLLVEFPEVALRLIDQLSAMVRAMNARVATMANLSPRQRVYAELLRLAAPSPNGDGSWVIDRVPTHDELACAASAAKQDVAMAIGALARDGLLERRHRSLVLRDQPRLRVLANM